MVEADWICEIKESQCQILLREDSQALEECFDSWLDDTTERQRLSQSASATCVVAHDDGQQLSQELEIAKMRAEDAEARLAAIVARVAEVADEFGKQPKNSETALEPWIQHQEELEIWKQHSATKPMQLCTKPKLMPVIHKLLQSFVHDSYDCVRARSAMLTSVEEVVNVRLWKQYCHQRGLVRDSLQARMDCPWVLDIPPVKTWSQALSWVHLDHMANEALLLHGTTHEVAEKIATQGFDERMCKRGHYGRGIYLSTDFCKTIQYCDRSSLKCVLVARVILGHPFFAEGPMRDHDRPPETEGHGVPHDSTIVRPGTPNGKGMGKGKKGFERQIHWEFVIPRGDLQIYPEMIVRFRTI